MSTSHTITISGWGQAFDSLACIAPDATHLAYAPLQDVSETLESLAEMKCDTLIGWSLGGQLALRAITQGYVKPKKLVLISTPFQFVESERLQCGMHEERYLAFKYSFLSDPQRALRRFNLMIKHNDSNQKNVIEHLQTDTDNITKWGYWLDELDSFSCRSIDFSLIPEKTLMIHGQDDVIVDATHTAMFKPFIPMSQIEIYDNCGHAPHLHDTQKTKELIASL